jgi:hypothetical protein
LGLEDTPGKQRTPDIAVVGSSAKKNQHEKRKDDVKLLLEFAFLGYDLNYGF